MCVCSYLLTWHLWLNRRSASSLSSASCTQLKAQAQSFGNALSTIGKFVIRKKVGDRDQIYGSVQKSEVSDAIYQQTGAVGYCVLSKRRLEAMLRMQACVSGLYNLRPWWQCADVRDGHVPPSVSPERKCAVDLFFHLQDEICDLFPEIRAHYNRRYLMWEDPVCCCCMTNMLLISMRVRAG